MMSNFRELKVCGRSRDLAVIVYQLTNSREFSKDYGFKEHIRKSVVSIPSNIAEGEALDTVKQSIKHFYIARGSLAELRTQLELSFKFGLLSSDNFFSIEKECDEISSMITSLIKHRSRLL